MQQNFGDPPGIESRDSNSPLVLPLAHLDGKPEATGIGEAWTSQPPGHRPGSVHPRGPAQVSLLGHRPGSVDPRGKGGMRRPTQSDLKEGRGPLQAECLVNPHPSNFQPMTELWTLVTERTGSLNLRSLQ